MEGRAYSSDACLFCSRRRACNFVAHCDTGSMNTSAQPVRLVRSERTRRRVPVAVIMALSFGTLVLLSVGGVLALSVGANYRNTFDLLGAQSTLLIDAMEDSLRAEMGRAESAVDGVAQLYAQGEFQIDDEAMFAVLAGTLSAAPEATVILICTPDLNCRGEARAADDEQSARSDPAAAPPRPRNRLRFGPPWNSGDRSTDAGGVPSWPTSMACSHTFRRHSLAMARRRDG